VANFSHQTRMGEIHGWYVYLVEEEGSEFCKIGTALTIDHRLSGLQHGNPRPLSLAKSWHFASRKGALAAERKALELCGALRVVGRDWMKCSEIEAIAISERAIASVGGLK
jgi:hypothetical protein